MHVDLVTLYLLAIGTLLASCAMTLWERRSHPKRSRELGILASAYATLAFGCVVASFRQQLFPPLAGAAVSNLILLSGYLLILHGVAAFSARQYRAASLVLLGLVAIAWALGGAHGQAAMWAYGSALPISLVCATTARELLRSETIRSLQARLIAALVLGAHALFYAFRAFVLPWLTARYGTDLLSIVGKITMYEGVLYSVVLPMTLLRLVREEAHGQLVRESQTDYLTGLGNRRRFFEEGARAIRPGNTAGIALLAFDLDRFKTINDRYGHETGDAVLKSFAQTARGVLGADAILARIGGEEFAALLPGRDLAEARRIGEAVVERFGALGSHGAQHVRIAATVSGGLAHSAAAAATLDELLGTADSALYRAKSLGGNRLELALRDTNAASSRDDVDTRSGTHG